MMEYEILVVDDDEDMRITLSDLLMNEGYRVSSLGLGDTLIEEIERARPKLVLLDLSIPGFDPAEASSRMHARGILDEVTVLAVSGLEETAQMARRLGFHGALVKPFELDRLFSEVRRICGPPTQGASLGETQL